MAIQWAYHCVRDKLHQLIPYTTISRCENSAFISVKQRNKKRTRKIANFIHLFVFHPLWNRLKCITLKCKMRLFEKRNKENKWKHRSRHSEYKYLCKLSFIVLCSYYIIISIANSLVEMLSFISFCGQTAQYGIACISYCMVSFNWNQRNITFIRILYVLCVVSFLSFFFSFFLSKTWCNWSTQTAHVLLKFSYYYCFHFSTRI